jgi:hypothetical protein
MPRKYDKKVIAFRVVMRMPPEAVARCWEMDLTADDIKVLQFGERMRPACLWPRPADKSRKRVMWYWIEEHEVGGRLKPLPTGCEFDDLDGALAWTLCYLSRKKDVAMARLAPEEIKLADLFDKYLDMVENQHRQGLIRDDTKRNYTGGVGRLTCCFGRGNVMDVVNGGRDHYYAWSAKNGIGPNTQLEDANTLKRAINWPLEAAGSAFRVQYWVGMRKPTEGVPLDPDEYGRVMHVLEMKEKFDDDLKIVMTRDPETGEERPWKASLATQRARVPFTRAFPAIIDSHSRPAVVLQSRWISGAWPSLDPDTAIWLRNPTLRPELPEKRKGLCLVSPEFKEESGAWMEEDLGQGVLEVVHDWRGRPVKQLSQTVWKTILKHAKVRYRKFYCAKHTSLSIALAEHVPIYEVSERSMIAVDTLTNVYAARDNPASQIEAAKAQGEKAVWISSHAVMKERLRQADEAKKAREQRLAANPPPPAKVAARRPLPPGRRAPRKPPAALISPPGARSRGSLAATLRTRGRVDPAPGGAPPPGKTPSET